jgi:hypothetical protein
MGARKRVEIGLSYRPARLQAGGIDSLESIPGLQKRLKFGLWFLTFWVVGGGGGGGGGILFVTEVQWYRTSTKAGKKYNVLQCKISV